MVVSTVEPEGASMFTLQFGQTNKARNSTYVPPVSGSVTNVLLRENTSVVNPTFRMRLEHEGMSSAAELFQYNYCYCPEFKRYYFITNITSYTAVIFDIECICDVLATFRDDILSTRAFIMYAQNGYNSSLPDSRLPRSCMSDQHLVQNIAAFTDDEGCYCLTLASPSATGETGCAQSYILSSAEMSAVAEKLYSTDFFEKLIEQITNPLDAVISCIWTPIKRVRASAGLSEEIKIGDFPLGSGAVASKTISGEINIEPYVKYYSEITLPSGAKEYSYADYRNIEPFAEYSIWLPGVGLAQIPMHALMGRGKQPPSFTLEFSASPCTGDVTYNICRGLDADSAGDLGSTVEIITGNFGVQIPVAQRNTGYMSAIGNTGLAVGSAVVGVAATMASKNLMALGAIASTISHGAEAMVEVNTTATRLAGTLGGWANTEDMYTQILTITRNFDISDSPSNIRDVAGLPVFQAKLLGSMRGLVKCTGAYVKTWATEQEHNMIAQYVNSSTNFIFGGLIIE